MSRAAGAFLLAVGLLQMAAALLGWPLVQGLAAATAASPAPRVFSSVRGLETYSSRFLIEWEEAGERRVGVELTPELGARLRGPYNRRNAYGAVVAYAPVLASSPRTRPLFEAVAATSLCGDAPLLRELGIDDAARVGPLRLRVEPRAGAPDPDLPLLLEAPCK